MSYTYLLEQGAESSAESFLDIPAFVLSRLNLIPGKSYYSDSGTESCQNSLYGMMCGHSTENRGEELLMSSAPASRAKTFRSEGLERELMAKDQAYGAKPPESFARFVLEESCWKTHQLSLFGGLEEFLGTWPRWGIMQNGECWELEARADQWNASGFGLPAPTKSMGKRGWGFSNIKPRYSAELEANAQIFGYKPHPSVLEWSMGWIPTWTRLAPLAMDKFQAWLRSHGEHLAESYNLEFKS
jgi:hypothetical protein